MKQAHMVCRPRAG